MKFNRLVRIQIAFCWVLALFAGRVAAQSWTPGNLYNHWTSVVMSADGSKIAADAFLGGFSTSTNGGTNWLNSTSPDASHWSVLATSTNGGNLLAAFKGGGIYVSSNWAGSWTPSHAPVDPWNCAALSADGSRAVAGTSPGVIYTSKDSGATFTSRLPQASWQAFAGSLDGHNLVAAVNGGGIYRSTDLGETWAVTPAPATYWFALAASANGTNLAAVVQNGGIYTSTDAGNTWTLTSAITTNWSAIASSADGSKLVAAVNGGWFELVLTNISTIVTYTTNAQAQVTTNVTYLTSVSTNATYLGAQIYASTDSGAHWSATSAPSNYWSAVYSSPDGSRLAAAANGGVLGSGGSIYFSTNSGASWTNASAPRADWSAISAPADGSQWLATVNGGLIYRSTDGGASWTNYNGLPGLVSITYQTNILGQGWTNISTTTNSVPTSPSQYWSGVAASADGSRVVAIANNSIFTAFNSGTAWQTNVTPWQVADGELYYTSPPTASNRLVWAASGYLWVSNNLPYENWSSIYSSPDGNTLLALARDGWSCKSTNGGATWTTLSTPYNYWQSLATSADGSRLLAASAGYLYQSTDAGMTWCGLIMTTNVNFNVICSNTLTLSGNSFYTNYYGSIVTNPAVVVTNPVSGMTVTNPAIVTTNYPVITYPLSDTNPILMASNFFTPGKVLNITNSIGVDLFGSAVSSITNTYATNTSGGVTTITTNTYPIFSTNVVNILFDDSIQGSNGFCRLADIKTNFFGVGALGTNFVVAANSFTIGTKVIAVGTNAMTISTNAILVGPSAITIGTNVIGIGTNTITIGTNVITIGTNAIVIDTNAIVIGTNVISIGTNVVSAKTVYSKATVVMNDSAIMNDLVGGLVIPDVSGMTASNGVVLATSFVNVLSTNVWIGTNSGVNLLVTNVLNVTVVITNVIQNWSATASSADGSHLAAAVNGGLIYLSTNSGTTWFNPDVPSTNWSALAMSADGSELTAVVSGGLIYSSTNFGTTWVADNVTSANWRAVAVSASGADLVAVIYGGVFYTGQSPVAAQSAAVVVPALQIQLAGGNVVLSWPAAATNVVLQQSADLTGGSWSDSPVVPVVSNGQNQVSLPLSTIHSMFRLRQP